MIPSLVARELRDSIVEYLATTFALSEDAAYQALVEFLQDDREGIFRGPYLRVRLPFVEAPADAALGVHWTPPGFRPYAHQLAAWQRLSGRGVEPKPTLVTTGTGSGKSEAFLIPAIDHAIWARGQGQRGIKALVLYPMNALVTDQARRIAELLDNQAARDAGVTGGVWIGDDGTVSPKSEMSPTSLITNTATLMEDPPDILLTNYKMLDRLLTNAGRQRLWAANTRPAGDSGTWVQPLTYLVLDELHSYDGAQGTDVAMLLRRLGHRLGTATTSAPLAGVACIGTSATLGSSEGSIQEMCRFASKVFGSRFDASAVVGERRRTVAEVCNDIDFSLPVPASHDVAELDPSDLDGVAEAFTGVGFDDPQAVGDRLLRHSVTASLLRVVADHPRRWPDAVAGVCQQVREWGMELGRDPDSVSVALERFVALVSQARGRTLTNGVRPLFSVDVQIWIREVSRLKRKISLDPGFRWADSPAVTADDDAGLELPSVYCTSCGRAGWLGVANLAAGVGAGVIERLVYDPTTNPYKVSVTDRKRTRAMLRANPGESDLLWLDPEDGQVHGADSEDPSRIPVLVGGMVGLGGTGETRDEAAQRQECPSCGARDAIRFLGSRVTTLASVGITQMFGSDYVAENERKLLAFTDSVQDASHRAAFFSGRTHRFNLRATMSGALQSKGQVALPEMAEVVLTKADQGHPPADDLFALIPPDLLLDEGLVAAWKEPGTKAAEQARKDIARRLSFDTVMEAGLRSRLGRTLETTGTAVAEVVVTDDEWERMVSFAIEAIHANSGELLGNRDAMRTWAHGVIERLRLRGGIYHKFLDRYVAEHGSRWWIWGGADVLAPKFPKGISAPAFFASAPSDEFDPISGAQSWLHLWTKRVLGIDGKPADLALRNLLDVLAELGVMEARESSKGTVWGLPAERIIFINVPDIDGHTLDYELRCGLCAHRHFASPDKYGTWLGRPCLRLRCTGTYGPSATPESNYYRRLYRSGQIRRVVAAEHTGLLSGKQRELIEQGFKTGGTPDAPNVLAATPTLEMGIDIGDLSAVMLTAVPRTQSNYVQRAGRAGRTTGNSFITTFAEGDPRSLYFLNDPELMIAGDIVPPSCYLDAIEILRRQYLAFLVDQAAQGTRGLIPTAGQMPKTIGGLATNGLQAGGWLSVVLEAGQAPEMVARFVSLFGRHLDTLVATRLAEWAAADMRPHVEHVIERWQGRVKVLSNQRDRLQKRAKDLDDVETPTTDEQETHGRLLAELRYVARRITRTRNEDTLGALEALGLMPNYTLFDESVTLEVNLWQPNPAYDPAKEQSRRFISDGAEYVRPAAMAIRELAPGNYFYVNAHRVRIDAVDNGTEHEPAHSTWRFCPVCAWATADAEAAHAVCPRCGSPGVADQGSLLTVLPMKVVTSTEKELSARTGDDSDDRDREFHDVVTTVDIAPDDIIAAYMHTSQVFGVEATQSAVIRYLNLGMQGGGGGAAQQVRIDGRDEPAALFTVCSYCGGVQGVRGNGKDPDDPLHHRAWCLVRSGARKPRWDRVALSHQLVTEAVRILLPVAEFEADERVLTFKALLLLGLRDSFGGDPSHFSVLNTEFPAPGGEDGSRNQFVVIHDRVPGGTGYLTRLADPDRLRAILARAEDLISTCECQTRGEPGCHRCLYVAVGRNEIPFVSRSIALDLLDTILTGWELKPAEKGTVVGVNLSKVSQSELERRFKVLLQRWSKGHQVRIASKPDPDQSSLVRFDLYFQDGPHWEIREQMNLVQHGTKPDFYATRVDVPGQPPVAVYLDGWEFHGAKTDRVDHDAMRRASLREADYVVWMLSYQDVKDALDVVDKDEKVPSSIPFAGPVRHRAATGAKQSFGGDHDVLGALELGAFEQLMLFLAHPDPAPWMHLAGVTALAAAMDEDRFTVEGIDQVVATLAIGEFPVAVDEQTGVATGPWNSLNQQEAWWILEHGGDPMPTVVLAYDTTIETDRPRWQDWLHLGNLFQHLGTRAVITTNGVIATDGLVDSTAYAAQLPTTTVELPSALLDEVVDPGARTLGLAAVAAGCTELEVGFDSGDAEETIVEIAWPASKVGILPTGGARPTALDGWDVREPSAWTAEDLLAAIEAGGA